ncbi:hypothetical protein TNCV_1929521 [Trichonephila clavipes]|nr:hypothetical protein TNCV_1929521 [Trichonephila clavipes]
MSASARYLQTVYVNFFQAHHQGHEKADEPFSVYVNVRLMPTSCHVQSVVTPLSWLCGDHPSDRTTCLELKS